MSVPVPRFFLASFEIVSQLYSLPSNLKKTFFNKTYVYILKILHKQLIMLYTMTVRNYIELNSVYISEVQNNFY